MLDVDSEIVEEPFDWFNRFSCDDGQFISRVPVGTFVEEQIQNERRVFIDVYKVPHGYVIWNEWDFSSEYAETPEHAQEIIENLQDTWIELAANGS